MEIERLLAAGNRRLEQQFSKAAKMSAHDADGLGLAGQRLVNALRSHFDLKVGTVYPVLYDTLPDAGMILEAEIEIEIARELIGRLDGMKPFDERYQPMINILGAWVERHLELERVRLLAAARRAQPSFARRMPEVRTRFAQDAAVLAEPPEEAAATNGSSANGRSASASRPRGRSAAPPRRVPGGSSSAGLLN